MSLGIGTSNSIVRRRVSLTMLAIGAIGLIAYANQSAETSLETEQAYLKRHPLTAKQTAANAHFSACWRYRNASHIVLTEKQHAAARREMLFRRTEGSALRRRHLSVEPRGAAALD